MSSTSNVIAMANTPSEKASRRFGLMTRGSPGRLGLLSRSIIEANLTLLERVRKLCLALPEAFEVEAWEHPTFRVGSGRGKMFCIAADDGASLRLKADPIERATLLEQGDPFYVPAYVGHKGWLGVQLDESETDWEEV